MERFTRIARLAILAIVFLLLFPATSCTTDSESDLLYERSATTNAAETDPNKGKEDEKNDFIDKRKVTKGKRRKG